MKRLTLSVTDEQYASLIKDETEPMAKKVRRILAEHFGIAAEEVGEKARVFKTRNGDLVLPSHILKQIRTLYHSNEKIAAAHLVLAYCKETFGTVTSPTYGPCRCFQFGLVACAQVCDTLWAEWGAQPSREMAGFVEPQEKT